MHIEQFVDPSLAHNSYAILSRGEVALIDPSRDPGQYYQFTQKYNAKIVAVIETHPHADFVSSHLEIAQTTRAIIYVSKITRAQYPHTTFDNGDIIKLGSIKLIAINTPGHSPDSICIIATDEQDRHYAIFTGDTLFVGDVGRPDLREKAGNIQSTRKDLASAMYKSTREKLMKLEPNLLIYPAHGAGSLCGKNLSKAPFSTIEQELKENPALQPMQENEFIQILLEDQPFIPKYFEYSVNMNTRGASAFEESIKKVPRLNSHTILTTSNLVIDTRSGEFFKSGHYHNAINLQDGPKFETWLGSIVKPDERFFIIAENEAAMEILIKKIAKIGYESNIEGVILNPSNSEERESSLNVKEFKAQVDNFTIIDIRNNSEVKEKKIFPESIHIPLPELRDRINEIPLKNPIVVHCVGGYRSAAGASIIKNKIKKVPVYDLSTAIKEFA